MVKSNNKRIEPLLLSVQETTQLQIDLKAKNFDSFEQWIIAPTRDLFVARIKKTYPELKTQTTGILDDVYRKVQKQILKIEVSQEVFEANKAIWLLTQVECKLALPTTENRKKNLGLSRSEFKKYCAQLKNGDETLIEKVYLSHFKKCMNYLIYNDKANSEEAHACTIDALIEIRKDLLGEKIFYGNLGFYFTNRAKSKLYKQRVKKKEFNLPLDGIDIEDEEKTETELVQKELSTLVRTAINKLCEDCKNIIKQFYYEGKTLKEISEHSSKTHSAIRKQTTRCRDKLRGFLGEQFYEQFSAYLNQ